MTPEGAILRAVLDYLAAKHILAFRMNSGALRNPAGKLVAFGVPGMADVLAFARDPQAEMHCAYGCSNITPVWLEVKAPKGTQSEIQKSFQRQVEDSGHVYAVVRSIEDVDAALGRSV